MSERSLVERLRGPLMTVAIPRPMRVTGNMSFPIGVAGQAVMFEDAARKDMSYAADEIERLQMNNEVLRAKVGKLVELVDWNMPDIFGKQRDRSEFI